MSASHAEVAAAYAARTAAARTEVDGMQRTARRIGALRLGAFAFIVVMAAGAVASAGARRWYEVLAAAGVAAFVRLIAVSERLKRTRARAATVAAVNEEAAARVLRDWDRVPRHPVTAPPDEEDAVAGDLDIFGPRSLAHLLPPLSRAHGAPRMRAWLTAPATPEVVATRQAAARELVSMREFGEALAVHALRSSVTPDAVSRCVAWGAADAAPLPRWLDAASVLLPAAFIVVFALELMGVLGGAYWLIPILLDVIVAARARRRTAPVLEAVEGIGPVAADYGAVFALLDTPSWTAGRLVALRAMLRTPDGRSAGQAFARFARLAGWAAVRASPMMHGLLEATLLWDVHVARAFLAWRRGAGPSVGAWFDALAEVECLTAFAGLAAENPEFTFPHVRPAVPTRVAARSLGHPLLPSPARVANDVVIGPPGTVQLVSGSNMAGKSTLLRAVGLNVVLALAGAPVCADEMTCPPVRLRTSIHVRDSLERGLSYFMAEVSRLREIVTAAGGGDDHLAPVLYLVDEILSGTNSEERAVAIRLIIERLLGTPAIGIMTTHDLPAFCVDPIQAHLAHAHFRERLTGAPGRETMDFDYRLYDGPATSRNALRLLAAAGLVPAP